MAIFVPTYGSTELLVFELPNTSAAQTVPVTGPQVMITWEGTAVGYVRCDAGNATIGDLPIPPNTQCLLNAVSEVSFYSPEGAGRLWVTSGTMPS